MAAKGLLCLNWRFGSLHGHPLGEQGEDLDIVLAILEVFQLQVPAGER